MRLSLLDSYFSLLTFVHDVTINSATARSPDAFCPNTHTYLAWIAYKRYVLIDALVPRVVLSWLYGHERWS